MSFYHAVILLTLTFFRLLIEFNQTLKSTSRKSEEKDEHSCRRQVKNPICASMGKQESISFFLDPLPSFWVHDKASAGFFLCVLPSWSLILDAFISSGFQLRITFGLRIWWRSASLLRESTRSLQFSSLAMLHLSCYNSGLGILENFHFSSWYLQMELLSSNFCKYWILLNFACSVPWFVLWFMFYTFFL